MILFLVITLAALAVSAFWNVRLLGEVQRLTASRHARPGSQLVGRPVNGRSLGTQPRETLYRERVDLARKRLDDMRANPTTGEMRIVMAELRNMKQPVYQQAPQLEVLTAEQAERVTS